jgi:hypothetical protein
MNMLSPIPSSLPVIVNSVAFTTSPNRPDLAPLPLGLAKTVDVHRHCFRASHMSIFLCP